PWGGFYAIGKLDGFELHLKEAPKNPAERKHRRDNEHLDAAAGVDIGNVADDVVDRMTLVAALDMRDKLSTILARQRVLLTLPRPTRLGKHLMKKRQLASIPDAELKVMEELWRRGEATIRDLRDALYPQGGSSKFATVQKLLARLGAKKLVRRRKNEANWVFHAVVARNDLIGGELRRVADRLSGNSLAPLLTYLVEAGELTSKERVHLRNLLDEEPGAMRPPGADKS